MFIQTNALDRTNYRYHYTFAHLFSELPSNISTMVYLGHALNCPLYVGHLLVKVDGYVPVQLQLIVDLLHPEHGVR